jgi:saccharopine dehydrogenase-like NADP-dependent oxidoreductase
MTSPSSPTLHWLGTGLSSPPGLKHLANQGLKLNVWNRTVSKAEAALGDAKQANVEVIPLSMERLSETITQGDIVISMLPAGRHLEIAERCLKNHAHLITASYLSEEMQHLDTQASSAGLCFVNEVGLDPGLDHLLAYEAVQRFRETPHWDDPNASVRFQSLCGGLSEVPNEFCYRFSWSPLGVLKALRTPAKFRRDGQTQSTPQPWTQTESVEINSEHFEAYPNRDSLPFIKNYGLEQGSFQLDTFVRGSLRLNGWRAAWQPIFQKIPVASDEDLASLSHSLWEKHSLQPGENDRVVLWVSLESRSASHGTWHHQSLIDHVGDQADSAMAKLVSLPVAYTALSILNKRVAPGVTCAPRTAEERNQIFGCLSQAGVELKQSQSWSKD